MNVKRKWVKGHTGDAGTERADYLADQAKLGLLRTGGRGPDSPYKFYQGIAPPSIIPPSQDNNTDDAFTSFINNTHAATDQTLPTIKAIPRRPWISATTLDLIEQEKMTRLRGNFPHEIAIRRAIKKQARKDKKHWLHAQLEENQDPSGKELWKIIRNTRKGFQPKNSRLVKENDVGSHHTAHQILGEHLQDTQ